MSLWTDSVSNSRKARRVLQARRAGMVDAPQPAKTAAAAVPTVIIHPKMGLLEWTIKYREYLGPGVRFDLDEHLYLEAIYGDTARQIVVKKASQLGLSEWAVSKAFWTCDKRNGNVFYVMPSDTDVYDFSQMRFGPAVTVSDYLSGLVGQTDGRRSTDRVKMKAVGDRFIVFRGANLGTDGRARQLKSVPADLAIRDEVDEMAETVKEIVTKRLGHSRIKEMIGIATPTYTGFGIDAEFDESDQKYWFIPCPHCGEWQTPTLSNLVIESDDLGRPRSWHGGPAAAHLACLKCGKELNRLAPGEWVARFPDRRISGYQLTRLISAHSDPMLIVDALQTTNDTKRREIFNQDLGLAYTAAGTQIDDKAINECRREYAHGPLGRTGKVYAGVDVGKTLHVVIRGEADGDGSRRQLYAGEVTHFRDLKALFLAYGVTVTVIDANPETRSAREFQSEYPNVWLCYYQGEIKKKAEALWNHEEGIVNADRTRTLDSTYGLIYAQRNTLPANIASTPDYYDHIKASIRTTKQTQKGPVSLWINSKPDHYAHAENYCYIATLNLPGHAVAAQGQTHDVEEFFGENPGELDMGETTTTKDARSMFT